MLAGSGVQRQWLYFDIGLAGWLTSACKVRDK